MDITDTPPSKSLENLPQAVGNFSVMGDALSGNGNLLDSNGETIIDDLKPDFGEEEDELDLIVTVSNPTKQGDGFRSFVTYEINTKTSLPCHKSYQMCAKRRYNEFSWLYNNLKANYPGIVIAPIPDKKIMGKFQEKLLEERCSGFNMFLKRVVRHPVLKTSPELVKFLDPDYHIDKSDFKKVEIKDEDNMALQEYIARVIDSYADMSISPSKMEQWLGDKIKHFDNMDANLKALLKKLQAVSESRKDLSVSTKTFADSVRVFGEKESYEDLSKRLGEYCEVESAVASVQNDHVKEEIESFENVIKEHINMISAIKVCVKIYTVTVPTFLFAVY